MMVMGLRGLHGLRGLGDACDDCLDACPDLNTGDINADEACQNACAASGGACAPAPGNSGSSSSSSSSGSSSGTPWYQSVITGITQGAAAGIFNNGMNCTSPQNMALPQCQTQPWYTTPFGMIMIIGVLGGGIYLLTKK